MTAASAFERLPHVDAPLTYLAPMAERPHNYTYDPPPGVPRSNSIAETHVMRVFSARPLERDISLDREGFALLHYESVLRDFSDDDEIRRVYYSEAERVLAEATGAKRVHIRLHGASPREGWGGSCTRHATPAGDAHPRGSYGEIRAAARPRFSRRQR